MSHLTRHEMSSAGGCQCKMAGHDLLDLLTQAIDCIGTHDLANPMLLAEDAAVFEADQQPLLATNDLTALVGTDLVIAGRIAALHALSDIYASGGIPRWGLMTL